MKNIMKFGLFILLLGFIGVVGNGKMVFASSVTTLRVGTEYRDFDITGDGKVDTLTARNTKKNDIWYEAFQVYVNDKCVLTLNYGYDESFTLFNVITLSNGRTYLFIHLGADNDDGPSNLYSYKNGKLKKEIDFIQAIKFMGYHSGAKIHAVKGNKIIVWMESMSTGLAFVQFEAIYKYKAGKLKLQSKTHKIKGYYKNGKYGKKKLTVAYNMQLYKTKKLKTKSRTLVKGTKVRVTKCYISGRTVSFYAKTSDGKSGWFQSKNMLKKPFREIMYAG